MARKLGCSYREQALQEKISMAPSPLAHGVPGFVELCLTAAQSRGTHLDLGILGLPPSEELNPHWPEDPTSGSTLPGLEFPGLCDITHQQRYRIISKCPPPF